MILGKVLWSAWFAASITESPTAVVGVLTLTGLPAAEVVGFWVAAGFEVLVGVAGLGDGRSVRVVSFVAVGPGDGAAAPLPPVPAALVPGSAAAPPAAVSEPAPTEVTPPRASWKVGWRATVRPTPSTSTRPAVIATVRPTRPRWVRLLRLPQSAQSRPIAPRRIGISTKR